MAFYLLLRFEKKIDHLQKLLIG
ncbi:hypothetical protein [Priestia megaterium]